jgi:hypothetical protein
MRIPERYQPRILIGWLPYRVWEPIAGNACESPDVAKRACENFLGFDLTWAESKSHTPEGHAWHEGSAPNANGITYRVIPQYAPRSREPIPGAEFISQDASCWIYVVQEQGIWCTRLQLDYEAGDPEYMTFLGKSLDSMFLITSRHPLHHVLLKVAESREAAVEVGRYIWAREILRAVVNSQESLPVQKAVRRIALAFL